MRLRAGDGIVVQCNECDWRSSSASDLAKNVFIFEHEHRYAIVSDEYGNSEVLDSEQHDPGGTIRLRKLKEAQCPT
jgi:hypothetical protein